MINLAHISDIHLSPMPQVGWRDLLGKRITGYLNWKLKRHDELNSETLAALVRHLQAQKADFTAVTGDLVNLALPAEIERAGDWLNALGAADKVAVCPGNHDAYVPGALESAQKVWGEYLKGETLDDGDFPFVRRIGELAVISCSSAVPTRPFLAIGRFDEAQAERLGRILRVMGEADYFRTVLIHHPPNPELQHPSFGLKGHKLFREVIAEHGAELILHGHTHRSSIHSIPGNKGEVPVVGVAAASAAQGGTLDDPARYNLFRIERAGDGWTCTMREFGFQRLGTEIVMRLQMRIC
ncbi:metallophosphoesterase [Devosia sp. J2-20]|jgi:3',5'-cyclic AMP phosphodiesterase CpdA|uniref:Metallophosphoesterase n=1 Tax=Devosia litorisediminis TaxID=2829817 RepID=A0A942E3C3_9HYPH|nr:MULTISPECIES: metallophosphoesterase [Devosia]MBS3847473.1 metallophosphoesterase [Devosia litorisediminis]WDQ99406.1 metallophosphoesterase [Devosia sp. J2-20]|tara:strand:+ start:9293 stop:10183 length:891 start_codon:yes stop_codon:yes gene_type:complete